jgi:NhaP-type Na+/H+ or K+/H+ antiporter
MLNILILAGPGVLWGAILIGLCFKVILGYSEDDMTWYQAFTLGCVLSATDPVAVVALLK